MSPRVFKSLTQSLKKKKILDSASPLSPEVLSAESSSYSPSQSRSCTGSSVGIEFNDESTSSLLWTNCTPQSQTISNGGDMLYIIDNNVSYDHQASFYNHLNYISANAAAAPMSGTGYSMDTHDEYYTCGKSNEEEMGGSSSYKRAFSNSPSDSSLMIATSSPSNCLLLEDLVEIDRMVDPSSFQTPSEEYGLVFSRFPPSQLVTTKRRPSIPVLKKIPKRSVFRNPNADPFIDGVSYGSQGTTHTVTNDDEDPIYYEKVTSWLSPTETFSLISALHFDTESGNVDDSSNFTPVDSDSIAFSGTTSYSGEEVNYKEKSKNIVLSGLLRKLFTTIPVTSDDDGNADDGLSDEFVEIEFPGNYSDDCDFFDSEDDPLGPLECSQFGSLEHGIHPQGTDLSQIIRVERQMEHTNSYRSSLIEPSSYLVDYSTGFLSDSSSTYPMMMVMDEEDGSGFSSDDYLCDCNGICFCDAFIEIDTVDEDINSRNSSNQESHLNVCGEDLLLPYDDNLIAI